MLRLRRRARSEGARLHFGFRSIRWERGDHVVIFPNYEPYLISMCMDKLALLLSRAVPTLSGKTKVVDFRGPSIPFRTPSGQQVWLPGLIELNDTCAGYLARGAPGPGDIVLDAGAFCGELTIELALLVGPSGRVFAMEPDPANLEMLRRNLAFHRLENVTLLPHALWASTTDLVFNAHAHCGSSVQGLQGSADGSDRTRTITVSALSPADLFALIGRIPDFIKMDIEGAEVEAVSALAPLLADATHPVRLAIASYHLREGRPTHELITPVLVAAGLQVETGNPEHITTWALKP